MKQVEFKHLSELMNKKGVRHEAFELLADLRQSEQKAQARIKELEGAMHEIRLYCDNGGGLENRIMEITQKVLEKGGE